MTDSFNPPVLLQNCHLQTVWGPFFRRVTKPKIARTRMQLNDGDFIDLDWVCRSNKKLVVLLHGLAGSSDSVYIQGLQSTLEEHGYDSVCINARGCSGQMNRKLHSYHAGQIADIDAFFEHTALPYDAIYTVGFSLGGSMLANWLAQSTYREQVNGAALVSVPYILACAAERMKYGASRVYQSYLVTPLKRELGHKLARIAISDDDRNRWLTTLHNAPLDFFGFDNALTAPIHGFQSVDEYYGASSAHQRLDKIACPTMIIHALDDPFMTPQVVADIPSNANLTMRISQHGGHCGFIDWRNNKPVYWAENAIIEFFNTQAAII